MFNVMFKKRAAVLIVIETLNVWVCSMSKSLMKIILDIFIFLNYQI